MPSILHGALWWVLVHSGQLSFPGMERVNVIPVQRCLKLVVNCGVLVSNVWKKHLPASKDHWFGANAIPLDESKSKKPLA
jgi:hypothetical protein